jgi:hypothetical protein
VPRQFGAYATLGSAEIDDDVFDAALPQSLELAHDLVGYEPQPEDLASSSSVSERAVNAAGRQTLRIRKFDNRVLGALSKGY